MTSAWGEFVYIVFVSRATQCVFVNGHMLVDTVATISKQLSNCLSYIVYVWTIYIPLIPSNLLLK